MTAPACRRASLAWRGSCCCVVAAAVVAWPSSVSGQQLLERVVARVGGYAITLTDVRAALALGVVDVPPVTPQEATATQRLIDRQLVLAEVARFAPPEPDVAAVDREVEAMRARAGTGLDAVMQATGLDQARLRDIARDTLRIQAYLNQRFGITVQVSDEEVSRYYQGHQGEFMRDGAVIPLADVEPAAHQKAAALRRAATIEQWLADLRQRTEISEAASLTVR